MPCFAEASPLTERNAGAFGSSGIDQDELGVLERVHLYHRLIADGGTVTGLEGHAVDLDRALGRHQIAVASFAQRVFGGLARLQCRAENPRIGADRQSVTVTRIAARQRDKTAGAVAFGKRLGAPARSLAAARRQDPDLEDPGRAGFQIVFRVTDAGSGAHHLHVAGFGTAFVAKTVLMGDRPFADIGDDLHVGVRVRRKPGSRSDRVVIPYPERTPTHALGVVVVGKREMVLGIEPTMVRSAEAFKGSAFDHRGSPIHRGEISSAMRRRSDVSGRLKEETIETHRFRYGSSGSRSLGDLRQGRAKRLLFACGPRARPRQSDGFEGNYPAGTADRRRPPPPHLTQGGVERGRPQPARSRVASVERGRGRRSLCWRAIRGATRHGTARRADVIWSRSCGADPARVPELLSGSDDRYPSG